MAETALVTGGSGGIGLELARLLARDGCRLVLVARTPAPLQAAADELRQAHGVDVIAIPCDLSSPSGVHNLWATLTRDRLDIDILVNNAAFATFGRFAETDLQTELDEIQCNITALTYLTKVAMRPMLARGHGRILNVASTAAFQAGPLMSVYYASKAYVLHFSEAVAAELEGTGVTITTLCPGPVPTGFQARAKMPSMGLTGAPMTMDVRDVARIGYDAMRRGKRLIVPGFLNRLLAFGNRMAPRKLATNIVYRLQKSRATRAS